MADTGHRPRMSAGRQARLRAWHEAAAAELRALGHHRTTYLGLDRVVPRFMAEVGGRLTDDGRVLLFLAPVVTSTTCASWSSGRASPRPLASRDLTKDDLDVTHTTFRLDRAGVRS